MSTQISLSRPIKLEVNVTPITGGSAGQILFQTTGNTVGESANLFWNNTNARLGIGTSSPTKALHVNGNTFIQTVSNSDDGLIISNQGNIAFAGLTDVIGARFRGLASAFQMSDAAYNVKFVFNIASNLSYFNGGGNVAIGTTTDAGYKLDVNGTARIQTLTIGLGTGAVATNTVLGFQALNANTSGIQNVAIGYQSVFSNTTGSGNVAIGVSSLVFNSTGSGNTAFGDEALLRNTTGGKNIAIGQRAGTYAGSGTVNNQTSSDSIYIGYQARASASGATNELVFGKDTVGSGSNTVTLGNTSITKTILRGTVNAANLPTSPAGLASGDLWNNLGVLMIV